MTEPRLKLAVFVDFDNIEIGVKTTLGQQFDIAAILEAIKERGEVITKVAYGDWKRAGDYGRQLSQHAIRMVQRNLTPGGDKNGADINLALDALEMAFTHDHINAFVIVGGDSDFITLVEKLKQYDKKVFVVGGRQFTSGVMQRNCHEFIAYENLIGGRRGAAGGERRQAGTAEVSKAIPLVKRALKVLVDREVSPQLGLLKSTLLQLDSTFSERDYGASTFRDFVEKIAQTGLVTLKHAGRSLLVELADTNGAATVAPASGDVAADLPAAEPLETEAPGRQQQQQQQPGPPAQTAPPDPELAAQGVTRLRDVLVQAPQPPRWPMYIRQVKQFLRAADENFDERKYGFAGIVEFLRAGQREGLIRLERDRQGVLRVFPGTVLQARPSPDVAEEPAQERQEQPALELPVEEPGDAEAPAEGAEYGEAEETPEAAGPQAEPAGVPYVEPAVAPSEEEDLSVGPGNEVNAPEDPLANPRKRGRKPLTTTARTPRRAAGTARGPRAERPARAPRTPRGRKKTG